MTDERVNLPPFASQGTPLGDWRDEAPTTEFTRPRTVWDVVPYANHRVMPGQFLRDSAVFATNPHVGLYAMADRDLVRTLTVHVLADKLPPEEIVETARVVIHVPASWWQELKDAYRGRWWMRPIVRRRPVRRREIARTVTVTVDLKRWRTFPEADVAYPREFGQERHAASWQTHTRITD